MKAATLSLIILAFFTTSLHAQASFGPEVGGLFSNYQGKSGGNTVPTNARIGLRAGGVVDIGLSNNLCLQSGLFYVMNGYKISEAFVSGSANVNTLEIPILLTLKLSSPDKDRTFVGVGPYIARNLSGSSKANDPYNGNTSSTMSVGNSSTDDIKPFDFGLCINAGYQISYGLYIRLHYQKGFVNLIPRGNSDNSSENTNYGVSVGYLFSSGTKSVKK